MPYLTGRVVAVTGAGRGIGRACALLAAAEGASVVVNDADAAPAQAVADEITAGGGRAVAHPGDVARWAEAEALIARCVDEFGSIDGLVNNAGRFALADAAELDEPGVAELVDTNVIGVIAVTSSALRRMIPQRRGAIVNVVSGAHFGIPHMSVYAATKGAVASLTYSWSLEAAQAQVRVNAISPLAKTRMTAATAAWYRERGLPPIDYENSPDPARNAPVAVFLLSDAAAGLTGQILRIEGDQLAVVAHPAVREPVLTGDWTVEAVDRAIQGPLRGKLVPVGMAPLLRAEYLDGASPFWDGHGAGSASAAGPAARDPGTLLPPPPLDPEISAVLDTMAVGQVDWERADPGQIPAIRAALRRPDGLGDHDRLTADDIELGNGPAGALRARLIRPAAAASVPCLYWMHGGGYFSGSAFERDDRLTTWAAAAGIAVVSVEYRLAPESPYPGPFDDCWAGLIGLAGQARELGIDPARIGVGGGSAGGGLAAAVALAARDRGGPPLAFQLLLYPMIDDRGTTESSRMRVPLWPRAANQLGWGAYLGPAAASPGVPAYAAPARAADLHGLPPAYLCVGTADLFRDENVEYARRLMRDGVEVELHVHRGVPHGFHVLAPASKAARRSLADAGRFLREVAGCGAEPPAVSGAGKELP
jgi:acetyl esterase/lipase/NAD(P)-dependent dehydrogenase (short-subunit alcohol dehydrogenase family)